jgi:hypothetical protein
VFAALAVSRWTEERTGWSIKKFVPTAPSRPQAGHRTIAASDSLPNDLHEALDLIYRDPAGH